MRNAAAIALLTSLVLALVGISLAVSEHAETRARLDQRLALQADGEAGAVAGIFTRTRLALRLLAADAALRDGVSASDRGAATAINRALGSLERAEPGLAGAASAIGIDGRERARVVRGEAAPVTALARDVRNQPFFRATLGTRPGGVHVSQPYRSADTGQWVVSNSALVRDDRGLPLGIVRFELPLASVRATAAAALGREGDLQVAVVDRASGRKILDTSHGVLAGGPGWVILGVIKMLGGALLAYLAITHMVPPERAVDPNQMYLAAYEYVFPNYVWAVVATAVFVVISQLKINVTNAYAGSLAWSNFFSRVTHSHPGRVVWVVFNALIASC